MSYEPRATTSSPYAMMPPTPEPLPSWEPFDPFPTLKPERSFVNDSSPNDRLRVAYFRAPGDPALYAKAWFGPGAEGPPGSAHGGSVAAVLDEALGASAWAAGHVVLVARLIVDMRVMVPIGTDATIRATVERIDGRKIFCRARMTDADAVLAEAEALCVEIQVGAG